jgi:hypothetical protein
MKYVVEDKEFDNLEEAETYEASLIQKKAQEKSELFNTYLANANALAITKDATSKSVIIAIAKPSVDTDKSATFRKDLLDGLATRYYGLDVTVRPSEQGLTVKRNYLKTTVTKKDTNAIIKDLIENHLDELKNARVNGVGIAQFTINDVHYIIYRDSEFIPKVEDTEDKPQDISISDVVADILRNIF